MNDPKKVQEGTVPQRPPLKEPDRKTGVVPQRPPEPPPKKE